MRWGPRTRSASLRSCCGNVIFWESCFQNAGCILGVLLQFLALNWLNIWFFPMFGTKTQLLWGNLSIFDNKTPFFPQFWSKNSNKNYFFFKIGQFSAFIYIFFLIFGPKKLFSSSSAQSQLVFFGQKCPFFSI